MIRVGIVGFGKMGRLRAEAVTASRRGTVVAVFDPTSRDLSGLPVAQSADGIINDDSIDAPGLQSLASAAAPLGEPIIVAPAGPQSGVSHTVSMPTPISPAITVKARLQPPKQLHDQAVAINDR